MCTQVSSQQKKKIIPQNFIHLSLVSLTPVINIHSRLSPRIFEKIRNGPNGILRGPGDTDLWKKTWSRNSRVRLPVTNVNQRKFLKERYQEIINFKVFSWVIFPKSQIILIAHFRILKIRKDIRNSVTTSFNDTVGHISPKQ